jgi:hypothetical protein
LRGEQRREGGVGFKETGSGTAAMASAKLDDRSSLSAAYPREQFERDAASNADIKTEVLSGVLLLSAPDVAGRFELDRATRHVGEVAPSGDARFLYPVLGDAQGGLGGTRPGYGNEEPGRGARPAPDYEAFLDRVAETARSLVQREAPGRDDPRLRGERQ